MKFKNYPFLFTYIADNFFLNFIFGTKREDVYQTAVHFTFFF